MDNTRAAENIVFAMDDPRDRYSDAQAAVLLNKAASLGYPMDWDTYLQHMTLEQLDKSMRGQFDA